MKGVFSVVALSLLVSVNGRMVWPERAGRMILSRKVGNEHPAAITKLSSACEGQICGTLAGKCISTLLAAADPCAQQDCADEMIDVALAQTDATVQQNIIDIAIEFRTSEKNTQPDFRVQPPVDRFSVFCLRAPRNAQLNGLVQAQDSNANPLLFADPKSTTNGTTVLKGTARNTCPFTSDVCNLDTVIPVKGGLVDGTGAGQDTTTGTDDGTDTAVSTTVASTTTTSTAAASTTAATDNGSTDDGAADDDADDECDDTADEPADAATTTTSSAAAVTTSAAATTGTNLQTFTGALGGSTAPAVSKGGRGFVVEGSDDFLNIGAALGRSCDIQHNKCANIANSGGQTFNVGDCDQQNNACHAAINTANSGTGAGAATTTTVAAVVTTSVAAPAATSTGTASTGQNLQTFTGALGNAAAPAVQIGGRGFVVEGSDDFLNIGAALGRSCDIQHNKCANLANSGRQSFNVGACDTQNNECHAAISAKLRKRRVFVRW